MVYCAHRFKGLPPPTVGIGEVVYAICPLILGVFMFGARQRRSFLFFLLASTALSGHALALEPSGSAVRVTRITDAAGPGGARVLEADAPVYMGDEIKTNPHGLAQIRFVDDTKIVVGPNSRLVINTFVFNPDNTAQKVTVDAVKGFFRFISGKSPHSAYNIRTPTMTIGVRGTALDIHANGAASEVAFLEGSGFGVDANSQRMAFDGGCIIYQASRGGGFGTVGGRVQRQTMLSAYFPFIANPNALDPAFRVDTSSCSSVDNRLFREPTEPGLEKGGHAAPGAPRDNYSSYISPYL